ncbi:MAG: response regulator [Deltaproteobacteria bacterium]
MIQRETVRILIVDDEPYICEILSRVLNAEGYACEAASYGEEAIKLLEKETFHLMISDIMMPGMSGMDLLAIVKAVHPDLAVIMLTAVDDRKTAVEALEFGAYGYLIKPFDKTDILINVTNALERRRLALLSKRYEQDLEEKVKERTREVKDREEEIVFRLLSAMGHRDDETGSHARRIGLYAATLAEDIGWEPEAVENIRLAACMHDLGKIGIPDSVLQKPGPLTTDEFALMQRHSEIGARILGGSGVPALKMAAQIALSHHEKWDGSGYPKGLAGSAIPESARIVGIVDAYDALVHDRVYRPALPEEKAVLILAEGGGTHFDPELLERFIRLLPAMRRIRERVQEEPTPNQ